MLEILNALAAVATVLGFALDVAGKIASKLKGRVRRRMAREGVSDKAPENR